MLSPDSEESRKQFEAWAKDSWGEDATEKVGKDFCYSKSWISCAWQGWQAAIESVSVQSQDQKQD
jgi:hypothetical protein